MEATARQPRFTVNYCPQIALPKSSLRPASGEVEWKQTGVRLGYSLRPSGDGSWTLRLSYTFLVMPRAQEVALASTTPHYGGRRWWFACPGCQARAGRLYLHQLSFRCRKCHGLTYRSAQLSRSGRRAAVKDGAASYLRRLQV